MRKISHRIYVDKNCKDVIGFQKCKKYHFAKIKAPNSWQLILKLNTESKQDLLCCVTANPQGK